MTSNLVDHARRELELCGQYEEDPEYSESIIAAVEAFASYDGHSGDSAMAAREQLYRLLGFESLSPITSDPDDWVDVGEISGKPLWQNKRDSKMFSQDGGKTWYSVEENQSKCTPFHCIGQPLTSCDECGKPAWEHEGSRD